MEFERFKTILNYSRKYETEIQSKVNRFYFDAGMEPGSEIRNLTQIARDFLQKKDYLIIELPFKDKEIGAISYHRDTLGYTFLNTALPKVNTNFALCHEICHICYQPERKRKVIETYMNEHYYEHEDEYIANLFAGALLMPERSFKYMFARFQAEAEKNDPLHIIAKLMNYFEVPYMAALIRCYELQLLADGALLENLLSVDRDKLKEVFQMFWLNGGILEPTMYDEYEYFEKFVRAYGEKYLEDGYVSERLVSKALDNMRKVYEAIREEV